MPNFALHVLLASRVVESWTDDRGRAPFDPTDSRAQNAFYYGAVAPDMGLYPGGDRVVSDLVHRVRTGRLVRALVASAESDVERAFAWGWLTHLLADVLVHPLVNLTAARSLGRTEVRLEDPLQEAAHVRVEMGLDAICLTRYPFLRQIRLAPVFDVRSIGFLRNAMAEVYGIRLSGEALLRSHWAVVRLHRPLLFLARLTAHRWGLGRTNVFAFTSANSLLGVARRVAAMRPGEHSPATALFAPLLPDPELFLVMGDIIHDFPSAVRRYQAAGLTTLPDFDLETGKLEEPASPTFQALATFLEPADRGYEVRE